MRRTVLTKSRGVAAVEMAVVLPLILLLLFVTAEIGRGFMQYNTLTKSVRDSARYLGQTLLQAMDHGLM